MISGRELLRRSPLPPLTSQLHFMPTDHRRYCIGYDDGRDRSIIVAIVP